MDAEPHQDRRTRDADDPAQLRAKIRSATRWSIALGLYFVVIGLPIAANSGKGGTPILEPSPEWAPWIFALGLTGLLAGAGAIVLAMRIMKWEGRLPRRVRK